MREKTRKNIFSCRSCSVEERKEQSKLRQLMASICPGHIGLFLTAVVILVMQVMR